MYYSPNRADIHHCAFRLDEQRHKSLGHAQDAPEIDVKDLPPSLDVDFRERDRVARASIVDEVV